MFLQVYGHKFENMFCKLMILREIGEVVN